MRRLIRGVVDETRLPLRGKGTNRKNIVFLPRRLATGSEVARYEAPHQLQLSELNRSQKEHLLWV